MLELVRICDSSYLRLGGCVLQEICLIGAKAFWFIKERSTALKSKLHSDENKRKKGQLGLPPCIMHRRNAKLRS